MVQWGPRVTSCSKWRHAFECGLSIVLFLIALVVSAGATEIHAIDLKQDGSAILVIQDTADGSKRYVLIDTGRHSVNEERGAGKVKAYLSELGIRELDLLVLTHRDADHAAGFKTLISDNPAIRGPPIRIRHILEPAVPPTALKLFYEELKADAWKLDIPRLTPESSEIGPILHSLGMTVFSVPWKATSNENDLSLVLAVRDTQTMRPILVTGDLTRRTYRVLRDKLPTDVLAIHAPHHGGDPVLLDMLKSISARALVFSANADNKHGHPRLSIMQQVARGDAGPGFVRTAVHRENWIVRREALGGSAWQAQRSGEAERVWAEQVALPPQATPAPEAERWARRLYDTVFVTGERGNVVIAGEHMSTEHALNQKQRFLLELAWLEMAFLKPAEIEFVQSFREALAYSVRKVDRILELLAVPDAGGQMNEWLGAVETVVRAITGIDHNDSRYGATLRGLADRGTARALAQSLVAGARSDAITKKAQAEVVAERALAIRASTKDTWGKVRPNATDEQFETFLRREIRQPLGEVSQSLSDMRQLGARMNAVAKKATVNEVRWWIASREQEGRVVLAPPGLDRLTQPKTSDQEALVSDAAIAEWIRDNWSDPTARLALAVLGGPSLRGLGINPIDPRTGREYWPDPNHPWERRPEFRPEVRPEFRPPPPRPMPRPGR